MASKVPSAPATAVPRVTGPGYIAITTVENGITTLPGRPAVPPATSNVAIGVPEAVLQFLHGQELLPELIQAVGRMAFTGLIHEAETPFRQLFHSVHSN